MPTTHSLPIFNAITVFCKGLSIPAAIIHCKGNDINALVSPFDLAETMVSIILREYMRIHRVNTRTRVTSGRLILELNPNSNFKF